MANAADQALGDEEVRREFQTKLSVDVWPTWARANGVSRGLTYKLAARGEIEGLYRVGNKYRVATAPWRHRLGLEMEVAA